MQSDDETGKRYDLPHDIYDSGPTSQFESRYRDTEHIVQEQTVRRLNREYNQEQQERSRAIRTRITVVLSVVAVVVGFLLCKMMGWGEP